MKVTTKILDKIIELKDEIEDCENFLKTRKFITDSQRSFCDEVIENCTAKLKDLEAKMEVN